MEDLLKYNWEKYVGRRQPPLRGELAFRGTLDWLINNGFEGDYSKLYIYFSNITEKGIISDHYINNDLRNNIVAEIKKRILVDISFLDNCLKDFKEKTEVIKKFSLKLFNTDSFAENDLQLVFEDFCRVWTDFGPNLYILLLIVEGCEKMILDDFNNDPNAKSKLMEQVSFNVESEFFGKTKNMSDSSISYFPDKYNLYINKLIEWAEFRDRRKVVYDDSWYKYSDNFFKKIESVSGLGEKVFFLSKGEIENILLNKKIVDDVALPSLVYGESGEVCFLYGDEVSMLKDKIMKKTSGGEIRGVVACKGIACGRVRLVEPHVLNQQFEEGEILVTRMTTPDLMSIIKKALAIVTNEGGVTCHAAIISRELNKPCIIGTKIATDALKDGDIVEVDANNGIIRKL
ncbi:MAG TPA: hypothetical protein DEB09_04835 [Candidatus Magasanikbacteria bacterium]|nr:hypothetical protein [Candidatus Magasanikbacteria bacterium]